jgi:hypothetical protein
MQDGADISGTKDGDDPVPTFSLKPAPFKIEVLPLSCKPGLALETPTTIKYLQATPIIFAGSGYWQAGDLANAGVLGSAAIAGNPRTTLDEEISIQTRDVEWARGAYKVACNVLTYCPQVVKAYRTAWPFLDPKTTDNRGLAEFTLFSKFSPMSGAAGREIYAVVYAVEGEVLKGGYAQFYLLKPNILRLKFSQR